MDSVKTVIARNSPGTSGPRAPARRCQKGRKRNKNTVASRGEASHPKRCRKYFFFSLARARAKN